MSGEELRPEVVLRADVGHYEQNIRTAEQSTNSLIDSVIRLGDQLSKIQQATGRQIQLVGAGTTAGLVGATAAAARFQQQMEQIEASSSMAGRSIGVARDQVNDLRGSLSTTTNEAVGLITQLNKMGQGGRPVGEISKEFVRLAAVTGESLPALTQSMVGLQRQMGVEGLQNTRRYTSTLANLSEQAGVSAQGITDFANAITPVSQAAGMGMEEILGFSTAFNKAGADGFAAANAYSKMVNDITKAIQFGGPQLAGYSNLLGMSQDQLREMPVAETVTRVFEAIASEGPRAQKILEQFGLEGMRNYRAIAAVAQRGDMRANQRIAGEDSLEEFAEAAEKALSGVNDQLTIFGNNLTRIGQGIGATFLPAAEALLKVVNGIAGAGAGMAETLGFIPGGLAAAGAVGALGLGTAVRGAGVIATAAGVQMFRRSAFRAGIRNARQDALGIPLSLQPGWAGNYARNMDAGDPRIGTFQRATYGLGRLYAERVPAGVIAGGGSPLRQAGRLAQYGVSQAIHGAGYLARIPFQALTVSRYSDIAARDQIGGAGWAAGARQQAQGRTEMGWAQGSMRNLRQEFRDIARGTRELNTEQRRYSTVLRSMRTEMLRFGGGAMNAGVGTIRMAGSGVMSGLGAAAGFLGLPAMAGMAAVGGGLAAWGESRESDLRLDRLGSSTEDTSGAAKYESALGIASQATLSFADAVNQARSDIIGAGLDEGIAARALTAKDRARVMDPNYQYTVPELANMSQEELASWISVNRAIMDPQAVGAAKYDTLRRTGNLELTNELWSTDGVDVRGRWAQAGRKPGFWGRMLGTTSEEMAQEYDTLRSEGNRLTGIASPEDLINTRFATVNQELLGTRDAGGTRSGFWKNFFTGSDTWSQFSGDTSRRNTGIRAIANQLGANTPEEIREIEKAYNKAGAHSDPDKFVDAFWDELSKSENPVGELVRTGMEQGGSGSISMSQMVRDHMADPFRYWGSSDEMRNRMRGTSLGGMLMPEPVWNSAYSQYPGAVESTRWRGQSADTRKEISDSISRFLEFQDDPRLQDRAALTLAENLNELTGGFRESQRALVEFRNSVEDVNDPLYQLANAALQISRMQEDRSMIGATRAERYSVVRGRFQDAEARYRDDPDDLEAARDYLNELNNLTGIEQDYDQYVRSIVRGSREMDISIAQQQEDYERQKGWSDADFNLGRERASEDFARARRLQDEARDRSINRALRDFNISRERSEYEFNLGRERQEASYARQLSRSWRDFNISRERGQYEFDLQRSRGEYDFNLQRQRAESDFYRQRSRAEYDFNLSRERQEEDFNHQLVLMAEQSARQIYNIYERVSVQRTLSGTNLVRNLEDQARRMEEQKANLEAARGMGLSDDAIRMLGLNEAANAQQLARLMRELTPELIAQLNSGVGERTDLSTELMMDASNRQFTEMMRQYELQRDRAAEDFQRSMERSREDFQRGMDHMRDDYVRGLERSGEDFARMRAQQWEDFNRGIRDQRLEMDIQLKESAADFNRMRNQQYSDFMRSLDDQALEYEIQTEEQRYQFDQSQRRQLADYNRNAARAVEQMMIMQRRMRDSFSRAHEEITGDLADLWDEAHDALDGNAKKQFRDMGTAMETSSKWLTDKVKDLAKVLKNAFKDLGLNPVVFTNSGGADPTKNQAKAEGGTIAGSSPHKKADNIPIWATAGEFMQPVDTVEHYGVDVMEAMRRRQVPKDLFQGFADGGYVSGHRLKNNALLPSLISFGRGLQKEGYHVGEHPLFGGVHPTAHMPTWKGGLHYIGHALDINYDGYGQSVENRMLDRLVAEVERRGLGYIWRSANHFSHIHVDTSQWRMLNGRRLSGGGASMVPTDIKTDKPSGRQYLADLFKTLKADEHFEDVEAMMALQAITRNWYRKDGFARAGAMLGYDAMMSDLENMSPEGNEPFNVPGGVERWRTLVLRALGMVGQPASLADITLRRMNQESSGNPNAINLWDINAKNGTPSKGLMQVIDPTFRAYAMKGYDRDIWDPLSNILASMRYALGRYGGLYSAYSRAGGYADGGLINWHGEGGIFTSPARIGVAERGPEMVLPLYGRGVEFVNEIINRANPDYRETFVRQNGVPEVSKQIVYNSSYDHSTHYHGDITVQAQDPAEMQRQLEMKKRQNALIGRR